MDENQTDKLGSRMRDIYADVAAPPEPDEAAPKHPSRRLRKNRYVTRAAARSGRSPATRPNGGADLSIRSLATQRPFTTLLTAAAIGYLLARLSR